jgi:pimeloyl-ACP methyl ester carboxylesterase
MPRFIPMPTEVALTLVPPEADPDDRDTLVAAGVEAARICAGTLLPFDDEDARREIEDAIDRAWHPEGGIRQAVAALADDDRTPGLRNVRVPTLVLHGTADPLILPEGGQETADAIPDAELVWIDGLGHEMPEAVWPLFLDPICALVARVEAA